MRSLIFVQADYPLDDELSKLAANHREVCLKTSHIDPVLLENARMGDFSKNADLEKHVYCVSKEIGIQDGSGNLQYDAIKMKTTMIYKDKEKVNYLVDTCVSPGDDPIKVAMKMFKCYYDEGDLVLL